MGRSLEVILLHNFINLPPVEKIAPFASFFPFQPSLFFAPQNGDRCCAIRFHYDHSLWKQNLLRQWHNSLLRSIRVCVCVQNEKRNRGSTEPGCTAETPSTDVA